MRTLSDMIAETVEKLAEDPKQSDCVLQTQAEIIGVQRLSTDDAQLLASALRNHPSVHVVNLAGNRIPDDAAELLAGAFAEAPHLQYVDLSFCDLSDEALCAVVKGMARNTTSAFMHLNACYNDRVGSGAVDGLTAALAAAPPGSALRHLELRDVNFDAAAVAALALGSGQLQVLDCSAAHQVAPPVAVICEALRRTKLTSLILRDLDVDEDQWQRAAEELQQAAHGACTIELVPAPPPQSQDPPAIPPAVAAALADSPFTGHRPRGGCSPSSTDPAGPSYATAARYSFNDDASMGCSPPPVAASPVTGPRCPPRPPRPPVQPELQQPQQQQQAVPVPAVTPGSHDLTASSPARSTAQTQGSPPPVSVQRDAGVTGGIVMQALLDAMQQCRELVSEKSTMYAGAIKERDHLRKLLLKERARNRKMQRELSELRRLRRSISPAVRPGGGGCDWEPRRGRRSASPRVEVARRRGRVASPVRSKSAGPPARRAYSSGARTGGSAGEGAPEGGGPEESPQVGLDARLIDVPSSGVIGADHDSQGEMYMPGATPPHAGPCVQRQFTMPPPPQQQQQQQHAQTTSPAAPRRGRSRSRSPRCISRRGGLRELPANLQRPQQQLQKVTRDRILLQSDCRPDLLQRSRTTTHLQGPRPTAGALCQPPPLLQRGQGHTPRGHTTPRVRRVPAH
eukprot:TRINITY_DN91_c1_g2_i1.p1 TRINITY_DN91_c1_g2~~TRINITY_DN91_c1_g2_i1.p1  ORF type:complete len:713 (+),score=188.39 TRINITY_DN91_c1_g2_i1:93-2141(+)